MKTQKQAAVLFVMIAVSNNKKERAELLRGQFLFEATVNGVARKVTHGEFFMDGHPPIHEVVTTTSGIACRDVEGGMCFIPFEVVAVPVAPAVAVAAAAPAPAPAPTVLATRTMRVSFGQELVFCNASFSEKLEIIAPSSGAVIEEVFADGKVVVTFVGVSRLTWTI